MSVINTFPIYKKQKEPDTIGLRSALFTGLIWEKGISPERFFSFLWESRTLKPANHPCLLQSLVQIYLISRRGSSALGNKGQYWDTCILCPPLCSGVIHGNLRYPIPRSASSKGKEVLRWGHSHLGWFVHNSPPADKEISFGIYLSVQL